MKRTSFILMFVLVAVLTAACADTTQYTITADGKEFIIKGSSQKLMVNLEKTCVAINAVGVERAMICGKEVQVKEEKLDSHGDVVEP